jgi:hypothetical protein
VLVYGGILLLDCLELNRLLMWVEGRKLGGY